MTFPTTSINADVASSLLSDSIIPVFEKPFTFSVDQTNLVREDFGFDAADWNLEHQWKVLSYTEGVIARESLTENNLIKPRGTHSMNKIMIFIAFSGKTPRLMYECIFLQNSHLPTFSTSWLPFKDNFREIFSTNTFCKNDFEKTK